MPMPKCLKVSFLEVVAVSLKIDKMSIFEGLAHAEAALPRE